MIFVMKVVTPILGALGVLILHYVFGLSLLTDGFLLLLVALFSAGVWFGFGNVIGFCMTQFKVAFVLILTLWPVVLLAAMYYLVPSLHANVQRPMQNETKDAVMVFSGVGVGMAIISIIASFVAVRESVIITNLLTSVAWLCVIAWINGGTWNASGVLQYWGLIALVASGVEVFAGIIASVHNAWNKNPTMLQGGGRTGI